MQVGLDEWIATIEREYLAEYVPGGGAAVKFVVVPAGGAAAVEGALAGLAEAYVCAFAALRADATRLHLIDQLFFALSRQIDWDILAKVFVRKVLDDAGLRVPTMATTHDFGAIAELNGLDEASLRQRLDELLDARLFRDYRMAQEFRIAMLRLCRAQLEPAGVGTGEVDAIRAWLRGELRSMAPLKPARIYQRIARHNARELFVSLCRWLRIVGKGGLVVALDVDRYLTDWRSWPAEGLRYTSSAALDVYEVFRQFIDDTDDLEACLIVVIAPQRFLDDPLRGLERYDPLKLRIWDEVHDRRRANPLASLVRLTLPGGEGAA